MGYSDVMPRSAAALCFHEGSQTEDEADKCTGEGIEIQRELPRNGAKALIQLYLRPSLLLDFSVTKASILSLLY